MSPEFARNPDVEFDLSSQEFSLNPYPTYRALRERAPVWFYEPLNVWLVSRYDDVLEVLTDADTFPSVDRVGRFAHGRTIVQMNGREHQSQRRLVTPRFHPGSVQALEHRIEEVSHELIDAFVGAGQADLVSEYTDLFAIRIIAELLGVPFTEQFHEWSTAILAFNSNYANDPAVRAAGEGAASGFRGYVRPLIDQRRAEPGDDLLSYLISATDGHGIGLDDDAILAFGSLMITAGSETTNHTIGNLLVNLLADEEQHQQAREDPELALGAFFETMRHSPAIQSVMRTTSRDVDIGGETIPADCTVLALLGAANRDERRFADPDRFDIRRTEAQQRLGFGYARHRCLGGFLAQAEVTTAVRHLLGLPRLRVREGTTPQIEGIRHRGPTELHVEFDAS